MWRCVIIVLITICNSDSFAQLVNDDYFLHHHSLNQSTNRFSNAPIIQADSKLTNVIMYNYEALSGAGGTPKGFPFNIKAFAAWQDGSTPMSYLVNDKSPYTIHITDKRWKPLSTLSIEAGWGEHNLAGQPNITYMETPNAGYIMLFDQTNRAVITIDKSGVWRGSYIFTEFKRSPSFGCGFRMDASNFSYALCMAGTGSSYNMQLVSLHDSRMVATKQLKSMGHIRYCTHTSTWLIIKSGSVIEYDMHLRSSKTVSIKTPVGYSNITDVFVDRHGTMITIFDNSVVYAIFRQGNFDRLQCVSCWANLNYFHNFRMPSIATAYGDDQLHFVVDDGYGGTNPNGPKQLHFYPLSIPLPPISSIKCSSDSPSFTYHSHAFRVNLTRGTDRQTVNTMSVSRNPALSDVVYWSPIAEGIIDRLYMDNMTTSTRIHSSEYRSINRYQMLPVVDQVNGNQLAFFLDGWLMIIDRVDWSERSIRSESGTPTVAHAIDWEHDRAAWIVYVRDETVFLWYPNLQIVTLSTGQVLRFVIPRVQWRAVISMRFYSKKNLLYILVDTVLKLGHAQLQIFDATTLEAIRIIESFDCVSAITDMHVDLTRDRLVLITESNGVCFLSLDGRDELTCQSNIFVKSKPRDLKNPTLLSSLSPSGDLYVATADARYPYVTRWQPYATPKPPKSSTASPEPSEDSTGSSRPSEDSTGSSRPSNDKPTAQSMDMSTIAAVVVIIVGVLALIVGLVVVRRACKRSSNQSNHQPMNQYRNLQEVLIP